MAGAIEFMNKEKTVQKVASSVLVSLRRPSFEILAELVEYLIGGTCKHKGLLARQFVDNWNWGY